MSSLFLYVCAIIMRQMWQFFKNHFARHSVLQLTRFICFGLTLRTIIQVVTGFEVIVENFGFKVHKMLPKIDLEQHL